MPSVILILIFITACTPEQVKTLVCPSGATPYGENGNYVPCEEGENLCPQRHYCHTNPGDLQNICCPGKNI